MTLPEQLACATLALALTVAWLPFHAAATVVRRVRRGFAG